MHLLECILHVLFVQSATRECNNTSTSMIVEGHKYMVVSSALQHLATALASQDIQEIIGTAITAFVINLTASINILAWSTRRLVEQLSWEWIPRSACNIVIRQRDNVVG